MKDFPSTYDFGDREIFPGVTLDPSRVNLRATNCQWISLRDIEQKCETGSIINVTKVIRDSFTRNPHPFMSATQIVSSNQALERTHNIENPAMVSCCLGL